MSKTIAIIGDSGSGKSTIVEKLVQQGYGRRLITHTTRPKRHNETDGVDYYFVNSLPETVAFVERSTYAGYEYGLSVNELQRQQDNLFFICDINGAKAIKASQRSDVIVIKINRNAREKNEVQQVRQMSDSLYRKRGTHDGISDDNPLIDFVVTNDQNTTIEQLSDQIVYLSQLKPHYQDQHYLDLLQKITQTGTDQNDRTNTGVTHLYGQQMRFDLRKAFPLLTSKNVPFRLIVSELLWFLNGDTNIRYLLEHNNHIWDEWAFERYIQNSKTFATSTRRKSFQEAVLSQGLNVAISGHFSEIYPSYLTEFRKKVLDGQAYTRFDNQIETCGELGPVYGYQWRNAYGVDQLEQAIREIKTNPTSRRIIVNAWNPTDIGRMALPPCHVMYQFFVDNGVLHCHLYQRSGDMFLGVPFNIASYALLTHIIANECDLQVGEFIHTIGDAHIYNNHVDQAATQLSRTPIASPALKPFEKKAFQDFEPTDFELINYIKHPKISAPVAI